MSVIYLLIWINFVALHQFVSRNIKLLDESGRHIIFFHLKTCAHLKVELSILTL
jgi:hypothetical protein